MPTVSAANLGSYACALSTNEHTEAGVRARRCRSRGTQTRQTGPPPSLPKVGWKKLNRIVHPIASQPAEILSELCKTTAICGYELRDTQNNPFPASGCCCRRTTRQHPNGNRWYHFPEASSQPPQTPFFRTNSAGYPMLWLFHLDRVDPTE